MTAIRRINSDWGTLRIGGIDVPKRGLVLLAGLALWLVIATLLTSFADTFAAAASNIAFVAGLFVLFSLTRTIGVLTVTRAFALGALAMAIMLLLGQPLTGLARNPVTTVDPIFEELLKLTPLALLFWQGRRLGIWQLSATDVLLIAAAAGAGFAVVEDAYIRFNEGMGDSLPFLPTTELYSDRVRGDRVIAGHAIWTALAGATIGLAWLMVRIRAFLLLAPLGLLISMADHIGVNSSATPLLGPLVIVLFLAGAAAAIALDLYVLRRGMPAVPELKMALAGPTPPRRRWHRIMEGRRLHYAAWRMVRDPARTGGGAEMAVRRSVAELVGSQAS